MHEEIEKVQALLDVDFFDYQLGYFEASLAGLHRSCLYYKTGAGKSITSMVGLKLQGWEECVVIAPPSTHEAWFALGKKLGMAVQVMSHAKFRMKTTMLSRKIPVIADEFHLFGGHGGQGWKKLDRLSKGLQAPLVLASATPNYNDAERVYCIQHVLDPLSTQGGYLQFLYTHCITKQNPFRQEPDVEGFKNFKDAAEFLSSLPGVFYVEDDVQYTIQDVANIVSVPFEFDSLNINWRKRRFMASQIEKKHAFKRLALLDANGNLRIEVYDKIIHEMQRDHPVLIFSASSEIATAVQHALYHGGFQAELVTGKTTQPDKELRLRRFREGHMHALVGTATLATGTDGLDKICHKLIIVDDTDDDALRRQLIGRIMHRGAGLATQSKEVLRFVHLGLPTP